jgi:hypothetical protein
LCCRILLNLRTAREERRGANIDESTRIADPLTSVMQFRGLGDLTSLEIEVGDPTERGGGHELGQRFSEMESSRQDANDPEPGRKLF